MNFSEYVGLEYKNLGRDRSGIDCCGLIYLIYKEKRGILLPDFTHLEYSTNWYKNGENVIVENIWSDWEEVSAPYKEFDVLLFYNGPKKRVVNHAGMVIADRKFIHVSSTFSSKVSAFHNVWQSRLYKALRYKGGQ